MSIEEEADRPVSTERLFQGRPSQSRPNASPKADSPKVDRTTLPSSTLPSPTLPKVDIPYGPPDLANRARVFLSRLTTHTGRPSIRPTTWLGTPPSGLEKEGERVTLDQASTPVRYKNRSSASTFVQLPTSVRLELRSTGLRHPSVWSNVCPVFNPVHGAASVRPEPFRPIFKQCLSALNPSVRSSNSVRPSRL
ncbi:hypothetical protein LR48_Vigan05g176000 [Vigna angularis]|uniref:Uncharacterized protein n=1 Tax=Phaseolus angularis TaxID=3914 RepID=A0A0L9UMM4_PHAAN|nr:hypothetical protein LR48_Vigan05g176000 [Vigna angularis]